MKKFALLASLAALVAFAAPATASAVVWGPAGTTSALDSPGAVSKVYFTMSATNITWSCSGHHLGLSVRKPASSTLDVTSATYSGCAGEGVIVNCTVTQTATSLPWTMQAASLTDVQFNVGKVNVKFTNTPGNPTACPWNGVELSFSGTVTGGKWNSTAHSVSYEAAPGLWSPEASEKIKMSATLKNNAGTLTLS
jgi:hypothetical protein